MENPRRNWALSIENSTIYRLLIGDRIFTSTNRAYFKEIFKEEIKDMSLKRIAGGSPLSDSLHGFQLQFEMDV